jgi:hypothetical protein
MISKDEEKRPESYGDSAPVGRLSSVPQNMLSRYLIPL